MAAPTLSTVRLLLRPFREADLDAYTEVLQAPAVRESLHLPSDVGREQAWQQMATWLGQWELRNTGQLAIERRDTGAFVGRAGSHWPERADWPGIEIGWTLHPNQWGQGFATEAAVAAITHTFATHDTDELFSVILPDNARSQAVAKRLGFELFETRIISHFPGSPHGVWRLPRSEWRPA